MKMRSYFILALCVLISPLAVPELHYYWPRFPRAQTLLTVDKVPSREMAMVLETLSGLAARDIEHGRGIEAIWMPLAHPAYERWFRMTVDHTGARVEGPLGIWDLVKRFQARGVVKGYILYRYDDSPRRFHEPAPMDISVNAATSLCAARGAIAVSDKLEPEAKALGLPMLLDVRAMTEEECWDKYRGEFNREILALQDPKANEIRSEAVALGAFVMSQPGPLYERVLADLEPDTPVLGWAVGTDEAQITKPATLWGHFQTATNWCHDLTAMSTEKPGRTYDANRLRLPRALASRTIWDLDWETDVHYATFLMSDGDNVQWLMGDFIEDANKAYWSSPERGQFPLGWTCCYVDLAQLCPYALEYLMATASPKDDFVLYGGGYFYPDFYNANRPGKDLVRLHARRIGEYMRFGGVRLLAFNAQDWDSEASMRAYAACAREIPDLLGTFVVQYAPYTAGGGEVQWVKDGRGRDAPVASARYSIWANVNAPRDDSPTMIAAHLNELPHRGDPAGEEYFSWVVVHAWSWFKTPQPGAAPDAEEMDQAQGGQPGTGRGVASVTACIDALEPHVRVVTPTDYMLLTRLHLRPRQTLDIELAQLRRRCDGRAGPALGELRNAEQCLREGRFRECFEKGKLAYSLLKR